MSDVEEMPREDGGRRVDVVWSGCYCPTERATHAYRISY